MSSLVWTGIAIAAALALLALWAWLWPRKRIREQPALPVSAEGEAFLAQGPAPDESMPGRVDRSDVEAMTEDRRRRDARTERHAQAADPEPDGWVADSWWARTLAWIGSRRKRGA